MPFPLSLDSFFVFPYEIRSRLIFFLSKAIRRLKLSSQRSVLEIPLSKFLIHVNLGNLCSSISALVALWVHPNKQLIPCITGIDQSVRDWLRWRWIHILLQTAIPQPQQLGFNVAPVKVVIPKGTDLSDFQQTPCFICFMSVRCL